MKNCYGTGVVCTSGYDPPKGVREKKENKKTKKYNFHGQSVRSRRWFNIDDKWLEENFRTREPDFYKKSCQTKFRGGDTKHIKYLEYRLVMKKLQ